MAGRMVAPHIQKVPVYVQLTQTYGRSDGRSPPTESTHVCSADTDTWPVRWSLPTYRKYPCMICLHMAGRMVAPHLQKVPMYVLLTQIHGGSDSRSPHTESTCVCSADTDAWPVGWSLPTYRKYPCMIC